MFMIPKTVNILSNDYTIQVHNEYWGESPLLGEILYNDQIIKLKKTTHDNMMKVLFHEIIHGICTELRLYDAEHCEQFVDNLAVGLYDTLKRNKMLKEFKK